MGTPNVLADRVMVATTTTGTGTYALAAAVAGYLDPAGAGVPSGSRVPYVVVDSLNSPTRFEVGEGIYTAGAPATLTRATVRRNTSGATAAENWPAGTKYLSFAPNVATLPTLETDGTLSAPAITITNAVVGGTGVTATTGMVLAAAGPLVSQLSGAPSQGQVVLGNANNRMLFTGTTFDLSASLVVTGNVTATNNFVWSSDIRGKEDIKPAHLGLRQALRIGPVTFQRLGRGAKKRRELGVIAQEVQSAHPLAVIRQPDGTLAVSAAAVDAILIGALHDLAAEVAALRERLAVLERKRRA